MAEVLTVEKIRARIGALRQEQLQFIQESNARMAGYNYVIGELERLLAELEGKTAKAGKADKK